MTTTSLPHPRFGLVRPSLRSAVIGFAVTFLAGLAALAGASLLVALLAGSRVMPGVSVGGVEIGGLGREAARERLSQELPSLSSGALTVRLDGESLSVPYQQIGRGYELDLMLDSALAIGRDPDPFAAGVARLRSLARGTSLPVAVHAHDDGAIEAVVAAVAERFTRLASSASVTLDGDRFVVTPAQAGRRVDLAALRGQLLATVASDAPGDVTLTPPTAVIAPGVTTAAATAAASAAERISATALTLLAGNAAGDARFEMSSAQLRDLIGFGMDATGFAPRVDDAAARTVLVKLAGKVSVEPRNASFIFGASGITGVKKAVVGRTLDIAASTRSIGAALLARASGDTAPSANLAFSVTQPALTTEAATAAAPKMRRISTWTTHYQPAISNYWGRNISIPAHDLDGLVLGPGEWFDFWNDIGPVTTAHGYGQGGAIINGKSELTGALAGGICSTSTTIFNAALRAGLEMGERRNHYYYISRYPLGLDATVFQTDGYTLTMTFRNDTPNPIVIRSYTGIGVVRFDLWSLPTGRTVTLTKPIVTNVRHAADLTEVDPSMKPGTRTRIETAHDGMNVSVTRYVRDAKGKVIHTDLFTSAYSPVNGRVLVGPTPQPAATPTPTPAPSPSAA
jgi:vancomycin resistance protein YoaR